MSYSYGPMGSNPMHTIMPIMGNMGNGANFLPPLGPSMQPMPGPSIISSMAGLNDSPLEFNIKKMQLPGAGPMELETVNEMERDRENRLKRIDNRVNGIKIDIKERDRSVDRRLEVIDTNNAIEAQEKGSITPVNSMNIPQSDLMYNRMMGVPQGFMMMPNMMNMMDHPMLGIQQFPIMSQMSAMPPATPTVPAEVNNSLVSLKEIISCKSCTLFPPNPNAPLPTTRERPPGCRTVFVGGLPENISEEIIREVFERCGEITTLRLSKKNFCHIRFVFEASVDSAIYLSGYRIRIGNNTDATNCGRLHVDYAQARDDQYEWECRQRQLQREQRHRERLERDRLRPLSPPPIVHYTDHEAATVSEKLKQDDSFAKAVQVLITWLERGDCSKKNANNFYTMIQSTNSHVRRLLSEKTSYEEELAKAKEHYKKQMQSMMIQFTQIEKVFNAASHKKVWDHFTKAQRKNIDMWKKQSTDVRSIQLGDIHDDDEMEMSDDEKGSNSGAASTHSSSHNHNHKINCGGNIIKRAKYDNDYLKEENDSLRCQLEAYKNEVNLVKSDLKSDTDIKEHQIKMFQETIRSLQTQLLDNKSKEKDNTNRINELENKLKAANVKELLLKTKILNVVKLKGGNIIGCASNTNNNCNINSLNTSNSNSNNSNCNNNNNNTEFDDDTNEIIDINDEKLIFDTKTSTLIPAPSAVVAAATAAATAAAAGTGTTSSTTQLLLKNEMIDIDEARIIGLVSTFLVVHPFGASTDYIWSYVHRIAPQLRPKGLEEILSRYNTIFVEEITGIGAKIERKWKFSGFDTNDDVNSQE